MESSSFLVGGSLLLAIDLIGLASTWIFSSFYIPSLQITFAIEFLISLPVHGYLLLEMHQGKQWARTLLRYVLVITFLFNLVVIASHEPSLLPLTGGILFLTLLAFSFYLLCLRAPSSE